MQYFNHDTGAASDPKIIALRLLHGGAAVDLYWVIAEQIYKDEMPLDLFGNPAGFSVITHLVSASVFDVREWVDSMLELGLLFRCGTDGNCVASERILDNIADYHAKAETARQNGKKGGRPPKKTKSVSSKKPSRLSDRNQLGYNKIKENKSVGFEKQNQTLLSDGACASECAAPESHESKTPHCASCGSIVTFDPNRMAFVCRECGSLHDKESVVFV